MIFIEAVLDLYDIPFEYDDYGNLYAIKGESESYPCVAAHTDTVNAIEKDYKLLQDDDVLFAVDSNYNRLGVGGDDKVGVYIALEMLRKLDYCKAAFFVEEEIGCVGSKKADMSFFKDVTIGS